MNRLRALLTCCAITVLAGCGGGLSQQDMMRHAIRRTPDDEDAGAAAAPAARPAPKPTADAAAVGPASPADVAAVDRSKAMARHRPPANDGGQGDAAARKSDSSSATAAADTGADGSPQSAATQESIVADQPLTPKASRQQAIDKLTAIGSALEAYLEKEGHYPPPAIYGARKEPLLSWRVALLPYLGHAELYQQFNLSEPWNSQHNRGLLERMPAVFASADVEASKTSFLLPTGSATAFFGRRGITRRMIEDGAENTVLLLEVDPPRAVPWTAPEDHAVNLRSPTDGLGSTRGGGFLVVWGGGAVNWVPVVTPVPKLQAIFTPDAGDGVLASQVGQDPLADLTPVDAAEALGDEPIAASPAAGRPTTGDARSAAVGTGLKNAPAVAGDVKQNIEAAAERVARLPVPPSADLDTAREHLRDLFQQEYRKAATAAERQTLAKRMFDHLAEIDSDVAGQYVLIDTVIQIAIQLGAVPLGIQATDELTRRFEVDRHEKTFDTLSGLVRSSGGSHSREIVRAGREAAAAAFQDEQYEVGGKLCGIALSAAQKKRDADQVEELQRFKQQLADAERAHTLAERALQTLDSDPADEHAAAMVGKYFCLIREDWSNGLPILAESDATRLAALAKRDLAKPASPAEQLELGNAWWQEAENGKAGERPAMQGRAAYWYRQAEPNLAPGLARVKIQRRLEEFDQDAKANALRSRSDNKATGYRLP